MELQLCDGDYVKNQYGGFKTVEGAEELLQRLLFKLTVRRGSFPLMPSLGSRLYLLPKEKKSSQENTAYGYIMEAVEDEPDVMLDRVTVFDNGEKLEVTALFDYKGDSLTISLAV